jgi:hypothetical protein
MAEQHLMKATAIKIAEIYIPAALRQPLDPKKLEEIAVSIADIGQQTPILVRPDGAIRAGERPAPARGLPRARRDHRPRQHRAGAQALTWACG